MCHALLLLSRYVQEPILARQFGNKSEQFGNKSEPVHLSLY